MEVKEFISHYTKKIILQESDVEYKWATTDRADKGGFFRLRTGAGDAEIREILNGKVKTDPDGVLKDIGAFDMEPVDEARGPRAFTTYLKKALSKSPLNEAFSDVEQHANVVTVKIKMLDEENTAINPNAASKYLRAILIAGFNCTTGKKVEYSTLDTVALFGKSAGTNEKGKKVYSDFEVRILVHKRR